MPDAFTAITIQLPGGSECLVRIYHERTDGSVEVDLRAQTTKYGPRVWTPVALHGGSFTVEQCENRTYEPITEQQRAEARERLIAMAKAATA